MARASQKVTVTVRTSTGEPLERLTDRPVRRMPDGVSGVVYGGRVYPINEGMFICLDDPSIPKADCGDFVSPHETLVVLAPDTNEPSLGLDRWTIESTRFGQYVVLDGTEAQAEELVRRLGAAGITVKRWAESWRPASDGYHYDWFIRLGGDLDREECISAVTEALGSSAESPATTAASVDDSINRMQESLLRVELLVAQNQLSMSQSQVTSLEQELEELRTGNALLKRELTTAKGARTKAEKKLATAQAAEPTTAPDLAHQAAVEELLDEAQQQIDARDEQLAAYADEVRRLHQRLAEAERSAAREQELREQLTAEALARPRPAGPLRGLEGVLDRMFDRLVLDETTVDVFTDADEFRQLSHLVRVLVDLDGKQLLGKKCKGYPDIYEVDDIHTGVKGAERMGRVYHRRDPASDKLLVFTHRKVDAKKQREFLAKISKEPVVLGDRA